MRSSIWIASVLATFALAAPQYNAADGDTDALQTYFELLSSKIQDGQDIATAPVCDLSKAQMPSTPALPPPTGLTLKHVAIGRGIQNYTCSPNNATAIPVSIGAVATLFNASCTAATNPDVLALMPNVALQFNLTDVNQATLQPLGMEITGRHFFLDSKTPFFTLDTTAMQLGQAPCSKNATVAAPAGAPKGQGGVGYGSVAWLQLLTKSGATGNLMEVYRLNTAGGSPPPTCSNMPATFSVQYSAEYWFWKSS